jgi:antitoxin Phd
MYIKEIIMATKVTTAEARRKLADIVNSVAYGKDTVVLTRRGKELAALISIEDLKLLQQLEEEQDIKDAWQTKEEVGENVRFSDLKKELEL